MLQLTRRADYALRLLIDLVGIEGGRAQIAQIAEAQAISRTHLMKIANDLTRAGFTEALRGRGGGIRLGRVQKKLLETKPFKLVAVATANKLARMAFAIMSRDTRYAAA